MIDRLKYIYDNSGNISEIYDNCDLYAKYTYDSINRLVREDNKAQNKTEFTAYDNCGNILYKKKTAFTLLDEYEITTDFTTLNYTYDKDRLLAFDGVAVTYDSYGNPTSYKDNALVWQNAKQLTKYGSTTFTYDGYGKRIGKAGIDFTYDSSNNLIKQDDGENALEFVYDHSGLAGIKFYKDKVEIYNKGKYVSTIDLDGIESIHYKKQFWVSCKIYYIFNL